MTAKLLTPISLGAIALPNRVVMAPMTRARSDASGVPTALMVEYYAQRAGAGLIITEATGISREGLGWPNAPGLWTDAQVAGWRAVTDAVHAAGGRIMAQLWHMGRLVHPSFLDGAPPVSASATRAPDEAHTYAGKAPYGTARALTTDEIARVLDDYEQAARNAEAAGFDGVQLHAANGYLIDQFLRDGTNLRGDGYGGGVAERCRLLREATGRLIAVWGADRVSVRLSPNDDIQGCADSDRETLFAEAARVLDALGIAFLEMRAPASDGTFGHGQPPLLAGVMRRLFSGPLVLNSDFATASAEAAVAAGTCDAVAFGRPYIANPDLAERIAAGAAWSEDPDGAATWYAPGAKGYTDYPAMAAA